MQFERILHSKSYLMILYLFSLGFFLISCIDHNDNILCT